MSNAMPKFDFSKATVKSDADLEAALPKKGKTSSIFKPGLHEVTITEATYEGPAKSDPTWSNVAITYAGAGGKTIRDYILVPSKDLVYGEKKTLYPFQRLQTLINGLGMQLTASNVGKVLGQVMGNLDNLKGLNVAIEVGFNRAHGKLVKTGESAHVEIVLANKTLLTDPATGIPMQFPNFDAAEAHATGANIAFDSFPRVLSYSVSSTPNKGVAADGNW